MYNGPIQLIKEYRDKLDKDFLQFYPHHFNYNHNIFVHWSAGGYNSTFDDYHYNIEGNGTVVTTFDGNPFNSLKAHTYHRNSGNIGVGVCAMQGATTNNYGDAPVTKEQLMSLIDLLSKISCNYLVPVGYYLTHAEAAMNSDYSSANDPQAPNDNYGPSGTYERWDFFQYINPKTLECITASIDQDANKPRSAPEGYLYFPDWLRGEVILKLQDLTRKYWHPENGRGM